MADKKPLATPPIHGFFFTPPVQDHWLGHMISEIWKERIYAPYIEDKKDQVIVDIGANIGITSYYFSQFAKVVYALEPGMEHFDTLTRMVAFNNLTNIIPINKALYTENSQFPLFHNKNKTMYSLHTNVDDKTSPPETVDAITLETLFSEYNIDQVDLLKLDVEGSEVELLSSNSFKKVADKIKIIIGEWHAWSGRHPNQVNEALKASGFITETIESDASIFVARRRG